uniref:Uncharacterized protein n=1 Tax=Anguilla anguilla TaxID=7936 RepID=A0A0E9QC55_ANGAN
MTWWLLASFFLFSMWSVNGHYCLGALESNEGHTTSRKQSPSPAGVSDLDSHLFSSQPCGMHV